MNALVIVRVIAIVCTGLAAGVFLGHRAGVSFARPHLSPSGFVQLQQLIHVHFKRMMPILMIAAVVASLTWIIMLRTRWPTVEFWFVTLAAMAMVCAAALTRAVNIPINNQLMTWSIDAPPVDLAERWGPWESVHSIRTVLAIVAFAFQVVALSVFAAPPVGP
jgi:uncharacterized membrane protein